MVHCPEVVEGVVDLAVGREGLGDVAEEGGTAVGGRLGGGGGEDLLGVVLR